MAYLHFRWILLTICIGSILPRKPYRYTLHDQVPKVPATYDMHRVGDLCCDSRV